jgi:hypothetical protein
MIIISTMNQRVVCGHHVFQVYMPHTPQGPCIFGFNLGSTAISVFKQDARTQAVILLVGAFNMWGGCILHDRFRYGGRNILEITCRDQKRLHIVFDNNMTVLEVKIITAQPWSRLDNFLFGLVRTLFFLILCSLLIPFFLFVGRRHYPCLSCPHRESSRLQQCCHVQCPAWHKHGG